MSGKETNKDCFDVDDPVLAKLTRELQMSYKVANILFLVGLCLTIGTISIWNMYIGVGLLGFLLIVYSIMMGTRR